MNKHLLLFALLVSPLATWPSQAETLKRGDLVAVCGDSITEAKLYSWYIAQYLLLCQPTPDLRTMQFGWSGETSWGFADRLAHDVLPFRPSVATVCYGMNDGGYVPTDPERLSKYRAALTRGIQDLKRGGVRFVVVVSPGVVDTGTFNRDAGWEVYNRTLSDFANAAREVAAEQGVAFADIHTAMAEAMRKAKERFGEAYHVAGSDGVHPSENGHLVMAHAILKALGCSGDIGTITLDAGTGNASATEGHEILSVKDGTVNLSSTKYPFCFFGAVEDPAGTRGMLDFISFNQDLNRFRLVVKNAHASRLKVTWGEQAKEFTAEELANGINLAEEFLENPFCESFRAAGETIREMQKMDSYLVKDFLHWTPGWSNLLPGNEDAFRQLESSVVRRAEATAKETKASIKPVRHTLQIEPVN